MNRSVKAPVAGAPAVLLTTSVTTYAIGASAATTRYEAENAPATCDGTIDTNHAGFSGSGFCNTSNTTGAAVEFTVSASTAESATLQLAFANGGSGSRSADVLVNGARVQSTSFATTGAWSAWTRQTWTVQLREGSNTVRVAATNAGGLPNVDYYLGAGMTQPPRPDISYAGQ